MFVASNKVKQQVWNGITSAVCSAVVNSCLQLLLKSSMYECVIYCDWALMDVHSAS